MNINMVYGLEIEAEVSDALYDDYAVCEYHSAEEFDMGDVFCCEEDSSIEPTEFNQGVEFISKPREYDEKTLESDLNLFLERTDNLKKVRFNYSTGCHIHLSFTCDLDNGDSEIINFKESQIKVKGKYMDLETNLELDFLKDVNSHILENAKGILSKDGFELFKDQFYRHYAQRNHTSFNEGKYRSWFLRNSRKAHIEFRSFNLRGVENSTEFKLLIISTLRILKNRFSNYFKENLKERKVIFEIDLDKETEEDFENEN